MLDLTAAKSTPGMIAASPPLTPEQRRGTGTFSSVHHTSARFSRMNRYAYSYDGEQYVTVGEQSWGNGKPKKLGVLAKNGGNPNASELECQFDYFELRCPNHGEEPK